MHAQKPQNINDQISTLEIHLGELHAKLPRSSQDSVPCHDQAQLVWRASEGLEGLAAVLVGGGGAWPGFEATRRVKLAARTTRGRAAAHGHTKQPGPTRQRVERSAKAEWSGGTCLELTSSWAIRQQEPLLIEALWMLSNRALDKWCVMRH